ncbi:MAG TPA: PhoH family protein [Phycisphaerales bacterium]|nr:PhoH family protein [Phycisphaerales bacterium]
MIGRREDPAPGTEERGAGSKESSGRESSSRDRAGFGIIPSPTVKAPAEPMPQKRKNAEKGVKTFVLDTNVLLHNPKALFVFQDNDVVIPFTVLEELDRFKGVNDDVGRNARECIRHLDRLRESGRLIDGVPLANAYAASARNGSAPVAPTGTLKIDINRYQRPDALREESPDNRIIGVAYELHKGAPKDRTVVFVSKDLNARIKSDALGIRTEDFENQKVNVDQLYNGFVTIEAPGELIDELYSERMLPVERLAPHLDLLDETGLASRHELWPNEFVLMIDGEDPGHTGLCRRLSDTEHVIPVTGPRKPVFGIMPRNVQQTMAMDLLLDDEVRMVTLIGSAGTGKTLLAVAAGMSKVFNDERFEKLLVARPIMPLGRDIGYLPGDKDEKLTAWMQPIFDNLTYLLSTRSSPNQHAESHTAEQRVQKLIADGRLVLEPLTYIRGRSIPHQFIIIDEAQNLTPHEVKTIVSRVGEGTKIILAGDIQQIDNPYLDSSSNGLSYAVERMKGLGVVGHVSLVKSERSELASLATERL